MLILVLSFSFTLHLLVSRCSISIMAEGDDLKSTAQSRPQRQQRHHTTGSTLAETETVAPILHHGLEYKGISALVGTGAKALECM